MSDNQVILGMIFTSAFAFLGLAAVLLSSQWPADLIEARRERDKAHTEIEQLKTEIKRLETRIESNHQIIDDKNKTILLLQENPHYASKPSTIVDRQNTPK